MLNSEQTRNLIQDYDHHAVHLAARLIRCAAALTMMVGVALFAIESDPSGEAAPTSGVLVSAAHANPQAADGWDRRDE